jgi:hypothetical protein
LLFTLGVTNAGKTWVLIVLNVLDNLVDPGLPKCSLS